MSALSASGMSVLIENCSNLPTSNKDLYSFTLFPILPFLVALHIYITSITISSGSKTKNKPSDKRFGKSKNKTATTKENKNSIRSSHNKMILFVP